MSTCVIDFDGTIASRGKNWEEPGPPCTGVKESLKELKDNGFFIIVLSARTSDEMSKYPIDKEVQKRIIEDYMKKHDIPYDIVSKSDKPVAKFYIDDRAIEYRGDWKDVMRKVKEYG